MARSIRIEFPGAFYHVMARGNRRETIFQDEEDRRFFLSTPPEACGREGGACVGADWEPLPSLY
jgi:hypothetical protein